MRQAVTSTHGIVHISLPECFYLNQDPIRNQPFVWGNLAREGSSAQIASEQFKAEMLQKHPVLVNTQVWAQVKEEDEETVTIKPDICFLISLIPIQDKMFKKLDIMSHEAMEHGLSIISQSVDVDGVTYRLVVIMESEVLSFDAVQFAKMQFAAK
jgi:hypothetical protein